MYLYFFEVSVGKPKLNVCDDEVFDDDDDDDDNDNDNVDDVVLEGDIGAWDVLEISNGSP